MSRSDTRCRDVSHAMNSGTHVEPRSCQERTRGHSRTLAHGTLATPTLCKCVRMTHGAGDDFVAAQRALADEGGFESFADALRSWIATVAIIEGNGRSTRTN
jgi:hypothetical protein